MCGITGFAGNRRSMDLATLIAMRDTLVHRGPDGCGVVTWNDADRPTSGIEPVRVGLAHRRLSIIDLSDAGAQPMCNEDDTIWITYNGEFYNFQDYRKELEEKGHVFKSHCDTETLLHLYEEVGLDETLRRINGMFAFGLWDSNRKELILARDRLGKKPLYYAHLMDGSLIFASEIKALLASGLVDADSLDPVALDQFWTFGFTMGARTVFTSIQQVEPAQYLIWRDGKLQIKTYWDCSFGVNSREDRDLNDWADELEVLLGDAIRIRLIADVPLGMFLSGGIDSSLVTALAAKKLNRDVNTFSIAFSDERFNEAPAAKRIAEYLGVTNTTLAVEEDMQLHFAKIAQHFDEPFGDSSAIPMYYVAKSARRHVSVALTGDGGDELFAGYETFREGLRLWGTRLQRKFFRRPLTIHERLWSAKLRWMGSQRGFDVLQSQSSPKHRRAIYSRRLQSLVTGEAAHDRIRWYKPGQESDWLSRMQYVSLKVNMIDDVLVKVDRMSMANSLECRSPLLDYRVVEFASRLPYAAKINELGQGKAVLRRLLSRYVPSELTNRPKQGFCAPWEVWCRGALGNELRRRWREDSSPYFRPEAAEILFPPDREGSTFRQWQAFSWLVFWDGYKERSRHHRKR